MPPKRRRRFQGLYYHSSPPKVLPMNDQTSNPNGRRRREVDEFSVKLSTIRIWMHEKDIGKLTRILWAGQGNRLRQQASTNPRVKRFLAAVPYVMNHIKEVHQAVIDNNLETLQAKLEPPVPPALVTGKDANGLNVIHKAAGLGHTKILEYLIGIWPEGANETDITGKTPLHWAASAKNNMRCYTLLTQAGCDEEALDYKSKTPSYYRHKPNEIERAFLVYVPDAPRVSPDVITDWDALSDDINSDKKSSIKNPLVNGNGINKERSNNDDSTNDENLSEVDINDGIISNEDNEIIKSEENKENLDENPNENSADNDNDITNDEASDTPTPGVNQTEDDKLEDNENSAIEINEANEVDENDKDNENDNAAGNDNGNGNEDSDNKNDNNYDNVYDDGGGDGDGDNDADDNKMENELIEDKEVVYEVEEDKSKDLKESGETEENKEESSLNNQEADNDIGEPKIKAENDDNEKLKMEIAHTEQEITMKDDEKENIEIVNKKGKVGMEENEENKENEEMAALVKLMETEKTENEIAVVYEGACDNATEADDSYIMKKETTENGVNGDFLISNRSNEYREKKLMLDKETDEKTFVDEIEESVEQKKNLKNNEKIHIKHEEDDDQIDDVILAKAENPKKIDAKSDEEDDEDVILPKDNGNDVGDLSRSDSEEEPEDEPDDIAVINSGIASAKKFDENHNNGGSTTSSLAIEGFVQGDSEDNTVQSHSAALNDEVSRMQEIIASGDMEQLAQIVLNGEGNKLLGMQSRSTDIQAFLNNVPNYMSKIRRVHEAAREGSLFSLQQALDRRKFAIAKDEISPNGATPLHVAVLFGHSDIVRYLAARFPETTTITDNDGRIALHYAAVIKDNGHFYNMLTQLGSNSKTKDKLGHTPEFYFNSESASEVLTYRELLSSFGAEDLEAELLSDQGEVESQSFQSNPIFKTEQGKYLANTLAEPLIEALTEIANKRPEDPISYLTGYLQTYMRSRSSKTGDAHSGSSKTGSTAPVDSNKATARSNENHRNSTYSRSDDVEADETESLLTPQNDDRDEHGQSMLHFACARSHRRGGLLHLIEESNIDITYRDELYRTARDVSLQANQPANAKEIDRYMLSLAVVGDVRPFEHFALNGYDHITDVTDDNEKSIIDIVAESGHHELADFLRNLRALEESREELHQMIRDNNVERVKEIVRSSDGMWLLNAKNYYGRTALHIAVLKESEEIVEFFVQQLPEIIKIGDNLERTPLHYAMGTNAIESLSRILINKGAKRTTKDLKGRQPSYYFMNKADVLRLQEEEDENR